MEIRETEKFCIITPLSPKLNERESLKLETEILNSTDKRIGIDLSFVHDCTIDFINRIKNLKNISLFNIPSDIFAILTSMNLDKTIPLFVSEMDFIADKHQLLNRKFTVV